MTASIALVAECSARKKSEKPAPRVAAALRNLQVAAAGWTGNAYHGLVQYDAGKVLQGHQAARVIATLAMRKLPGQKGRIRDRLAKIRDGPKRTETSFAWLPALSKSVFDAQ